MGILIWELSSPSGILALLALGLSGVFLVICRFGRPQGGVWLNSAQSLFGLVMLWSAFWFLRLTWPGFMKPVSLWVGSGLLLAGALIGALHLRFAAGRRAAFRKGLGLLVMAVGGALVINVLSAAPPLDWCEQTPRHDCLEATCPAHRATVLVFKATWCQPCAKMEVTLEDPRVRRRLAPYGLVRADLDENPELAAHLEITLLPTVVILDDQCRERPVSLIGYGTPEGFLEFLDESGL